MNNKETIQHCRKRTVALAHELKRLQREREHCVSNLHILNSKYRQQQISYEDYSKLWNSIITDLRYYERYTQQFSYLLREQEVELASLRDAEYNVEATKVLSFTLITVLLLLAGISTFTVPTISGITGFAAAESNTTTLAEIQSYYSIALSPGLEDGVTFNLSATPLGRQYFNTTENYNATNNTLLWITLSTDSNTNVDLCTEALSNLLNGTNVLGATNITFSNSTLSTIAEPALANSKRYSLIYQTMHINLSIGNNSYLRLWIDIPDAQPAGYYNNSLDFKAVKVTNPC